MRTAGFYPETHGIEGAPTLADASSTEPHPDETRIVAYLGNGKLLAYSPGVVADVFQPDLVAGSGSVLTDGEWVWPDELAHYVRTYGVRLDPEFAAHMSSVGWDVPELSDEDLEPLVEEFMARGPLPFSRIDDDPLA